MIPVLTPAEMEAVDAGASEPVEVLIDRAGGAVARAALARLGGTYGRRVVVIAGLGNNGADGRVAAGRLQRAGVVVTVVPPDVAEIPTADLVIDAAYGTGLSRPYDPPSVGRTEVLAVDIPSGLDGSTGEILGGALPATSTVTFAAAKPGLVLGAGPEYSGTVEVADIGLDVSGATAHVVTDGDPRSWVPARPPGAHKWRAATWIIAGSRGMTGAARLCATAALRSGAGYVRLSTPGPGAGPEDPIEAVGFPLPLEFWDRDVVYALERMSSMVIGPGLGRSDETVAAVRSLVTGANVPLVIDGDALAALGDRVARHVGARSAPTILTPHDGEFERLTGSRPSPDRLADVRGLAAETGAVVLLKGPTTVIAAPDGRARFVTSGDQRLASAGTGDVLAGIIGAFLARGAEPLDAVAAAAHLHGRAGTRRPIGVIASDLVDVLPAVHAELGVD